MKLLIRIIVTGFLVLLLANWLPGVNVAGIWTSLVVALVLGILNIFVKPILVLFTLPVTIITLGLFLLLINAVIISLCTKIVGGFSVDSFWIALVFTVILSVLQSITFALLGSDD
mgnify:FL=1